MSSSPITYKTTFERQLHEALQNERKKNQNLETSLQGLQQQVESLSKHIEELNKCIAAQQSKQNETSQQTVYETDEEELARETEWIRVKKRKTASGKQSPSTSRVQDKDKEVANRPSPQHKNVSKPPPIIIENVTSYPQMLEAFASTKIPVDCYQTKVMNNNKIKISATNPKAYQTITALLNNSKAQWHSFENKQTRDIRVMVKNLHHSIDPTDIINNLNQRGLKAKNATNKHKWFTANQKEDRRAKGLPEVVPLDMFIVSFDRETDINKIYDIKSIMNCKVKVEPMRKNKIIPQCKRCQEYGHTHNFCHKTPRCVKCGKQHATRTATNRRMQNQNAHTAETITLQTIAVAKFTKNF